MPWNFIYLIYKILFLLPVIRLCTHHFFIHLLAFVGKRIKVDLKLGHQVDKGIDPAFCLEKFIKHNYFFCLEYAITTLEIAPFVTDHISRFLGNSFYFI